jgi:DNA-directed RNA polymerase omega subunit
MDDQPLDAPVTDETPQGPREPLPPIESRFMFVDVAAMRAKQLRRGAVPRIALDHHDSPHKLERVAMEEVQRGLIEYSIPERKPPAPEGSQTPVAG